MYLCIYFHSTSLTSIPMISPKSLFREGLPLYVRLVRRTKKVEVFFSTLLATIRRISTTTDTIILECQLCLPYTLSMWHCIIIRHKNPPFYFTATLHLFFLSRWDSFVVSPEVWDWSYSRSQETLSFYFELFLASMKQKLFSASNHVPFKLNRPMIRRWNDWLDSHEKTTIEFIVYVYQAFYFISVYTSSVTSVLKKSRN